MKTDLAGEIKKANGYTTKHNKCAECAFFESDPSTDNFGPGDTCVRNPDVIFRVETYGVCNKFQAKPAK